MHRKDIFFHKGKKPLEILCTSNGTWRKNLPDAGKRLLQKRVVIQNMSVTEAKYVRFPNLNNGENLGKTLEMSPR